MFVFVLISQLKITGTLPADKLVMLESPVFKKIQSVCFYQGFYRAYRLREETGTTRQVWLHIFGRR